MKLNKIVKWVLVFILLTDLVFSFLQYENTPLSGDIEPGVLPDKYVQKVIEDPFGVKAILTGEGHVNPNRFFSHLVFMEYFQHVPDLLQNVTNPISSVYLAAALVKIIVQIVFIMIIALFVSGTNRIMDTKFLIAAVLVTPLFQGYGFWSRMGINDKSIAYTFFYAVPIVLLMVFLFPILNNWHRRTTFGNWIYIFLIPLIVILPLSGPLIPGIILVVTLLTIGNTTWQKRSHINGLSTLLAYQPKYTFTLLIPACLMSVYSIFLGFFYDINYAGETLPLTERFLRLPAGILSQVFHSLGFQLMLGAIFINMIILKKAQNKESQKLLRILGLIGIFSMLYIVLLPFGGYRPYRPNIIRYDTFMPVNVVLFYFFTASCYYIINNLKGNQKKFYIGFLAVVLLVFTVADFKGLGKNRCEKMAFQKMKESPEKIVALPEGCFVISWKNIYDYSYSESKAELIYRWGITTEKKLFYNEKGKQ
jgi:hypothetical protein